MENGGGQYHWNLQFNERKLSLEQAQELAGHKWI